MYAGIASFIKEWDAFIEIIIVDDGSSENIKKIIDENYHNEPRVKYFYKQK